MAWLWCEGYGGWMVDPGSDFREEKETEKQKSQRGRERREKGSKNNIEKIFKWSEKKNLILLMLGVL